MEHRLITSGGQPSAMLPCEGVMASAHVHRCTLTHGHVSRSGVPHACACGHEWVTADDLGGSLGAVVVDASPVAA